MKALAASSIGQYEQSVRALADYYRTVELGLRACLREGEAGAFMSVGKARADGDVIGAIVFGSDQGLVGQFNEVGACAESLASENASRLAAMERADRNIDELLENLQGTFHRVRQGGIDEELFDVLSGFEALSEEIGKASRRPKSGRD